jgi:hypothetical protein
MSVAEFEIRQIIRAGEYEVWMDGERIGTISCDPTLGWTAERDGQTRTCDSLGEAIQFIRSLWEPGVPASHGSR